MMEKKQLKIMRADIDLGGCTLQAYRDDANRDVVVIVPSNPAEMMTLGHSGPETFYAEAGAHVLVNKEGMSSATIYFMIGKRRPRVNLFNSGGDVCVINNIHDEISVAAYGYDVEVKPDTTLYSHDDCERMSEYDKVYSLLTLLDDAR